MQGKVFYAVLNFGLGHATRSLPIIREFVRRKWEVLIGSNGRSLAMLQQEVPEAQFVETPGYKLSYSTGNNAAFTLAMQTPRFMKAVFEEQRFCDALVKKHQPHLIVSDHCYGMYHQRVVSYLLAHQLFFEMPRGFGIVRGIAGRFNQRYYEKFSKVIIPDFPGDEGGLLSGRLSQLPANSSKYMHSGLLSSISKSDVREDIDVLVSISGPEPQRTIFEARVLKYIDAVPGKKVVLLGKSESSELITNRDNLQVYSHVPRARMSELFNRARLIVTRSGYSTLMELAELGKPALLVPTPGQTEQEYLAARLMKKRWYYAVSQKDLSLRRDVAIAGEYAGIFKPNVTRWTVATLFDSVFLPDFTGR